MTKYAVTVTKNEPSYLAEQCKASEAPSWEFRAYKVDAECGQKELWLQSWHATEKSARRRAAQFSADNRLVMAK